MPFVDPLERHRRAADRAVAAGSADDIKQLYVDLGADWWAAHAEDLDSIPVLSLPETQPVVLGELTGVYGRLLDAGCGPNPAVSVALARTPNRTVVSLDIGWGAVRIAREVGRREGVSLLGVVGDVEALPFRAASFDGVACDDTIEHLPDDAAGVAEIARVAGVGAPVVLATPNRHCLTIIRSKAHDRARGRRRPASAYFLSNSHLREYTWGEFERLIAPRFAVQARSAVGWEPRSWRRRLVNRAINVGPLRRVSQMIVVRAIRK